MPRGSEGPRRRRRGPGDVPEKPSASCSLIAPAIVAGDPRQQFLIPRLVRTETGDELRGPRAGDGHHRPASAIDEHAAVLGDAVGEWIVLEAHGRPTMTPDIAHVMGHGALP